MAEPLLLGRQLHPHSRPTNYYHPQADILRSSSITGTSTSTSNNYYYFLRGFTFAVYVTVALVLIASVRTCLAECVDKHVLAAQIALCFVGLTIPVSLFHVWEHLQHFVRPHLQAQVVRIVFIVPVYALEAYASISYVRYGCVFQTLREIYEAYVIFCFMRFLLLCFGDVKGLSLADRLAKLPAAMGTHRFPYHFLAPWQMGADFLKRCKIGVFQFVVVRAALSVLTLALTGVGAYEEGNWSPHAPFLWVTLCSCLSMSWALYCLGLFYTCCAKDLVALRPYAKFLCIKVVIFFLWFQALGISVLVATGDIRGTRDRHHHHTAQQVADLVQDLLVCMEMLVAAIAFSVSFPVSEFAGHSSSSAQRLAGLRGAHKVVDTGGSGGGGGVGGGGDLPLAAAAAASALAMASTASAVASIGSMIINPALPQRWGDVTGAGTAPASSSSSSAARPVSPTHPAAAADHLGEAGPGPGPAARGGLFAPPLGEGTGSSPTDSDGERSPRPSSGRKVFLSQRREGSGAGGMLDGGVGTWAAWAAAMWGDSTAVSMSDDGTLRDAARRKKEADRCARDRAVQRLRLGAPTASAAATAADEENGDDYDASVAASITPQALFAPIPAATARAAETVPKPVTRAVSAPPVAPATPITRPVAKKMPAAAAAVPAPHVDVSSLLSSPPSPGGSPTLTFSYQQTHAHTPVTLRGGGGGGSNSGAYPNPYYSPFGLAAAQGPPAAAGGGGGGGGGGAVGGPHAQQSPLAHNVVSCSSESQDTYVGGSGSGNGSGHTPYEAFVLVMPSDLHEDLADLAAHVVDNYFSSLPFSTLRRWLKGTSSS